MADESMKLEPKQEEDILMQNLKLGETSRDTSRSVTPSSSKTKSETPVPTGKTKQGPTLISDLPRAEEAAMKTFEVLANNHYQYSTLGRSREVLEGMACDCQYVPGDDPDRACGSDCINKLTQVECLPDECRCRQYCKNQRMQRKEYADIEVVQTEKKGFGLRAGSDIKKDGFIYEYIGDVVNHTSLRKRMKDYANEGLRHFYFMMLQKDEFIDATRRGGIGRFANHSCNPNCYVAKWSVGNHVRMGIYAKRNIKKDEELTFNYNVDRYGHEAQPCYCGEQNCVGVLGGKTQTDVAGMDDATLDALGISDELEAAGLSGSKKIKQRRLGDGIASSMKPMTLKDVPKVFQAIRFGTSKKILFSLLNRMKLCEDQAAMRQFMRFRGFTLMANLLEDFIEDSDLCLAIIEGIRKWPLLQRNKIDDSKIERPINRLITETDNEKLRTVAQETIDYWGTLELGYRIPKRLIKDEEPLATDALQSDSRQDEQSTKRIRKGDISDLEVVSEAIVIKPLGINFRSMRSSVQELLIKENVKRNITEKASTTPEETSRVHVEPEKVITKEEIIAQAARAAEEAQRLREEQAALEKEKAEQEAERLAKKAAEKAALTPEEKERRKERQILKLIGAVVVKVLSKHQDQFSRDDFKKHAQEITRIIAEKEKKSESYREGKLDALSPEKVNKVKAFAKDYINKLLQRAKKKRRESSKAVSRRDEPPPPPSVTVATED